MSHVIGGIPLGSHAVVRPAANRYRDMYGGAIIVEVTADGVCVNLDLDSDGVDALAAALRVALLDSTASYRAMHARRGTDPERKR